MFCFYRVSFKTRAHRKNQTTWHSIKTKCQNQLIESQLDVAKSKNTFIRLQISRKITNFAPVLYTDKKNASFMNIRKRMALMLGIALAMGTCNSKLYAQKVLLYNDHTVDSLTLGQRFSLRTNIADWVLLTPNIGIEFTLGTKNWSKWTLGAQGRLNWKTKTQDPTYYVYDLYDGRIMLRNYWHGRDPRRVFYWGLYAGAGKFDIKTGHTGYDGKMMYGGAMIGTIQQLYGYQNGSSIDLDLGLNPGIMLADMKEYHRTKNASGDYVYVDDKPSNGYKVSFKALPYLASTDILHIGLVYHFGTRVANRYKKRILIDESYRILQIEHQMKLDSLKREQKLRATQIKDSLEEADYERRFENQRLLIEQQYQKRQQQLLRQKQKLEAEEQKAQEKAARKREKANAKNETDKK